MFLLLQLATRDTGNEVDHVSNVQPIDVNQADAKSTLNLIKLMSYQTSLKRAAYLGLSFILDVRILLN